MLKKVREWITSLISVAVGAALATAIPSVYILSSVIEKIREFRKGMEGFSMFDWVILPPLFLPIVMSIATIIMVPVFWIKPLIRWWNKPTVFQKKVRIALEMVNKAIMPSANSEEYHETLNNACFQTDSLINELTDRGVPSPDKVRISADDSRDSLREWRECLRDVIIKKVR